MTLVSLEIQDIRFSTQTQSSYSYHYLFIHFVVQNTGYSRWKLMAWCVWFAWLQEFFSKVACTKSSAGHTFSWSKWCRFIAGKVHRINIPIGDLRTCLSKNYRKFLLILCKMEWKEVIMFTLTLAQILIERICSFTMHLNILLRHAKFAMTVFLSSSLHSNCLHMNQ